MKDRDRGSAAQDFKAESVSTYKLDSSDWRYFFITEEPMPLGMKRDVHDVLQKIVGQINPGSSELPDEWRVTIRDNQPNAIYVVDNKERNRAVVTMLPRNKDEKALFGIKILPRYTPTIEVNDDDGIITGRVMDSKITLFSTRIGYEDDVKDALEDMMVELTLWMNKRYPNWQDTSAHWDK